jgi:hypothetical protein
MAKVTQKKGPAKRREPVRTKTKKQSKKEVARLLGSGPIRKRKVPPAPKRPKTSPLPGMEDMSKLTTPMLKIMDSMADVMHRQNTDAATLKGLANNAMNQMKRDNVTLAKAHGIELVRVPGEEKLRKRLLDEGSIATLNRENQDDLAAGGDREDLDNGDGDIHAMDREESLANA